MYDLIVGISLIVFISILIFYRFEFKNDRDEFLSKNTTNCLKGLSILIVCIQHFCQKILNPGIFLYIFSLLGYLGVTMFLFLSGYGIAKSFQKKGLSKDFFTRRINKVYIPFVIINIITIIIYSIFLKESYSFIDILGFTLGLKLIDDVLWYVISILIFYLLFYVLYKYLNKNNATKSLLFFSILYLIICLLIGTRSCWYTASLSFFIGVFIALYKEKVDKIINNKNILYGIIFFVLFVIFSLLGVVFADIYIAKVLLLYFSSIAFLIAVIQLIYKIKLNNMSLLFLGSISYEIYLIHMKVFNITFINIATSLYIIPFLFISVVLGYLFNKAYQNISLKNLKK